MSQRCLETKCFKCCKETNMLLSHQDIEHIQKLGYTRSFFVQKHQGWLQLKNAQGKCVFHTGEICSIYEHRPEGCTLYPVVYEKDCHCAIIDSDCPQKHCFLLSKNKTQQLISLVMRLEKERSERKKTH